MYKDRDGFSATFGFLFTNFFSVKDLINLVRRDDLDATSLGGIKPSGVAFCDLRWWQPWSFAGRTSNTDREPAFSRKRFSLKDDVRCKVLPQKNSLSEAGILSESDDQSPKDGNDEHWLKFPLGP
jgi:hypothetical protein